MKYINYWLAALLCIATTAFSALGGSANVKWLIICDLNVMIFLFIAAVFDLERA